MPADSRSPYFFPAERGDKFYVGTKRIWPEAIKLAELPGVTPTNGFFPDGLPFPRAIPCPDSDTE